MKFWNDFAEKHPVAAKWIREGGLFVIVSNLITVFKYIILQFLPKAFSFMPETDYGWPGIPVNLFGIEFFLASPSGKIILFTKKKITIEIPPLSTTVPMLYTKSGTKCPATATHTQLIELTIHVITINASRYHNP